ncbi:hypothetical protein [Vibrio harveyi]|uniref:hypothetical protein n=1 Tax=Vibrio harveyi TaxID=669 RepID=UPI0006827056|nr:hypothetical protein [Vibrio harveyi]
MSIDRKQEIPASVVTLFVGVISVLVTINLWVLSDIKKGQGEQSHELKMLADDVSEFGGEIRLIKWRLDQLQELPTKETYSKTRK